MKGQGDYVVVTPTFPLLEMKALKEFRYIFEHLWGLGTYYSTPVRRFVFSEYGMSRVHGADYDPRTPTTVYFGYADNPDSLESATYKAAWLDEAGQKRFRLQSWEAIKRRLSLSRGRVLITTTPYDIGWLKAEIYDRWKRGEKDKRGRFIYDVINFPSIANPLFPLEEYDEARATLPRWKFAMFYGGKFVRPAGLIYDCLRKRHIISPRELPAHWPRTLGVDFGAPNIAGVYLATDPIHRIHHAYREYRPNATRSAAQHAERMMSGENYEEMLRANLYHVVGGSRSETQWRAEFDRAGVEMMPSQIREVEIGIDRVYAAIKADRFRVFDTLKGLLDEFGSYSRVLDKQGAPTAKIADKAKYHLLDALRYAMSLADDFDADSQDWTDEEVSRINPDAGLGAKDEDDDDAAWAELAVDERQYR